MPVVHPHAAGAKGRGHGSDYYIVDPIAACVGSAKLQIAMLYLLLSDNAKRANKVIEEFQPLYPSQKAYLEFMDTLATSGDRIEYENENTAKITL